MNDIYNHNALNYDNISKPIFPHKLKQWEWTPVGTFNNTLSAGDTVRFNIASKDFWDPYSAMLEIQVDISGNTLLANDTVFRNKVVQLDSSASSFFSSYVATCNGKEIERLNNYDILAAFLKDMSYDVNERAKKDYEGNGGISANQFPAPVNTAFSLPINNNGVRQPFTYYKPEGDACSYIDTNTRQNAQYQTGTATDVYYTTINHSTLNSQQSFQPYSSSTNVCYNGGNDTKEYYTNWADTAASAINHDPASVGCNQPYNPIFSSTAFEPTMSQTVPTRYLKSGFIKVDPIQTLTFQVPFLSSFFGCLMPPQSYKLIPLKYLPDLTFEFTFNPHALFTSFFSNNNSSRNYTIKKFSIRSELVEITDPGMMDQIEGEYQKGIRLNSQAWFYGPNYNITQGAIPTTLQINLGFSSLRNVFFMFMPNDHTINSAFRKQYRLSMAITSMQLKVGTNYYPQQPIIGNGGTNIGAINNNEFVKYLNKAFGKHCGAGSGGVVNQHNFAINCREADPTSTATMFTTDKQMNYFMENRVIGKAVYAIPLDALNYEQKGGSGIDTTFTKPFEILLTYDNAKVFTRSVTMHTWFHHDYMLYIGPNGIMVMGRT